MDRPPEFEENEMSKCLTCKHFNFIFCDEVEYSELTVDSGVFHIICMQQHFNHDTDGINEVDLYNLLLNGDSCGSDYEKAEYICTGCGRRGQEWQVECQHCNKSYED